MLVTRSVPWQSAPLHRGFYCATRCPACIYGSVKNRQPLSQSAPLHPSLAYKSVNVQNAPLSNFPTLNRTVNRELAGGGSPCTPSKVPNHPNHQSINVDADDAPGLANPLSPGPSAQQFLAPALTTHRHRQSEQPTRTNCCSWCPRTGCRD